VMWAVYTLAYKHSGLSSVTATAIVSALSAMALAPLGVPSLIAAMHAGLATAVIAQAVIQGVLSGVVAILLYGLAITRLGASGGAAFVALVPAFAAIMAIPVLGEWPGTAAIIGILATTLGVALSSGALRLLRRRASPVVPASALLHTEGLQVVIECSGAGDRSSGGYLACPTVETPVRARTECRRFGNVSSLDFRRR
jgi:uncharacterized membrane protein